MNGNQSTDPMHRKSQFHWPHPSSWLSPTDTSTLN